VSPSGNPDEEVEKRRRAQGENRLPPAVAVLVAGLAYALLPSELLAEPRFVVPGIELVLLIVLVVANPRRMERQTRWSRSASIIVSAVVIITNLVALMLMITTLGSPSTSGLRLLVGGMQIWFTNVIGFSLLFWELDRGGPVARHRLPRKEIAAADWRFSQDEDADAVAEVAATSSDLAGWIPAYVDYFYLSLTNSSAFSPTDTMPLSSRAKLLMGLEATTALFTTLIVIARAVGALGG
jgi:hypothetical protein